MKSLPNTRYSRHATTIAILVDTILIVFWFFVFLFDHYGFEHSIESTKIVFKLHYKVLFLFIFCWFIIYNYTKLYHNIRFLKYSQIVSRVAYHTLLFSGVFFFIALMKRQDLLTFKESSLYIFILFISVLSSRIISLRLIHLFREHGFGYRNALFLDINSNTETLRSILRENKKFGVIDCGMVDNKLSNEEIKHEILSRSIQLLYISLDGEIDKKRIDNLYYFAINHNLKVNFIPESLYDSFNNLELTYIDSFPVMVYEDFPLDKYYNQLIKRTFDLCFTSLIFILIFSWLFPIIILLIKISSPGNAFFIQKRNGKNGKEFDCYKFRTMQINDEANTKMATKKDTRVTKIGKILRKTSLDELPQFFNVLIGNMSIVGPRPHMIMQNKTYEKIIQKYNFRSYVKPGITGLAQVSGLRGEIYSAGEMKKRIISDIYYIKNWTFLFDIFIINKTIFNIFKGDKKAY